MSLGPIGILGGTFNPVHTGHLILAQCAFETLDLEKVLFVPCARPPHKEVSGLVSAVHRVAMLILAIEEDLRFELCDLEIRRGGCSYTIDTVKELSRIYPRRKLHFIVGTDTLSELHLWKDVNELLELCSFSAFARPGFEVGSISEKDLRLDPPWPERLLDSIVSGRLVDISSADTRYRLAEGMSIRYLVPSAVEIYIAEHGLYGAV